MSSNDAGDLETTNRQDPDLDMEDPENYGSLSIEDPDGDEDADADEPGPASAG